jgi:hypothetical protein
MIQMFAQEMENVFLQIIVNVIQIFMDLIVQ